MFAATPRGVSKRRAIDFGELKRLAGAMLIGKGLGLVVLQRTAERWLLLGLFVGALALWNLFGWVRVRPASPRWA